MMSSGSGLPSYTVPPASGAPVPGGTPYGVGGAGSGPRPFGGFSAPTAQVSSPPGQSTGQPNTGVPQQRTQGTVYGTGGYPSIDSTMQVPAGVSDMTMPVPDNPIDMTMPVTMNAADNSGSLTGHILAQGWRDEVVDRRRGNLKVAIAMLVVLGLLVTVSLVFLVTAGDSFTSMLKGLFG
jgi:hypothetical protein